MAKTCANCGQQLEQAAAFCGFCGAPYKAPVAPIQTDANSTPVRPHRPAPAQAQPGQEQVAAAFQFQESPQKTFAVRPPAVKESHGWMWYCFALTGRIGVRSLWLTGIAAFVVLCILVAIVQVTTSLMGQPDSRGGYIVLAIISLILIYSWIAVFIKRIDRKSVV